MLSPCIWQVTHALLTRPPLECHKIWPKSRQRDIPVRLACVKHAASVHPEPGSNSLKISLIRTRISLAYPQSFITAFRFVLWKNLLRMLCILLSSFRRNLLLRSFSGLHYCLFVKVQWENLWCRFSRGESQVILLKLISERNLLCGEYEVFSWS